MPGVVDEHVETTKGLDGLVDHALGAGPAAAVVAVRDGLSAGRGDLVDDLLRGRGIAAFTGARTTEVVDHDRGTFRREQQRFLAADAAARPSDDRDLAVEQTHSYSPNCWTFLT